MDSNLAIQRLLSQEADSKEISQLDDVSSPPAAAVSSVASQLHGPNMGNMNGKEVVRSVDDNNAVISRSHDPPLHAVDPLRLRASSAGSNPWASRNNAATVFAHQASAGSSSTPNWNGNEFSGEKSIWGEWKVFLTPDREKLEIPQAVYDAFNNPNPGSSGTWERKLSPTSTEPHDNVPWTQQDVYQGSSSSRANGNASGWGSFQGAGRTCYQSPPIQPYSPAPFNIPQTRSGSALYAQYQYRQPLLPANANNWRSGEGSSPQYDYQGGLSWQRPGTRARPNHQQQSPYNRTTSNLQDPSSMQPPRESGP